MFDTLTKAEQMALDDISDSRRAAWIVADDAVMRAELAQVALSGGVRAARQLSVDEALDVLDERLFGTLMIVECGDEMSPSMARLLERLDVAAAEPGGAAIVGFPIAAVDIVTALLSAPYANLLCSPTLSERVAAVSLADVPVARHFAEADMTTDRMRLQNLAEEVGRIARVLAGYAESDRGPQGRTTLADGMIGYRAEPVRSAVAPVQVRADDIRTMIRLRRQRDRMFPADLFADPAWDMMLDLMAARIERLKVAVSSLCIAAAVPPTTALRWIKTLTDLGIFVRVADPTDGRRVFIELSDAAAAKVLEFVGEAKRAAAAMV